MKKLPICLLLVSGCGLLDSDSDSDKDSIGHFSCFIYMTSSLGGISMPVIDTSFHHSSGSTADVTAKCEEYSEMSEFISNIITDSCVCVPGVVGDW